MPSTPLQAEGNTPVALPNWPLLRLGFRPFYLLAALYASLAVPLWLAHGFGIADGPHYLRGALWHAHEMIFGFAAAVIVGFLFTAARNWTGLATPTGASLGCLAILWIAGRVLVYTGPAPVAAVVDTSFLPCAAYAVFSVLRRSGNTRNYPLVALLGALAAGNLACHLAAQGMVAVAPAKALFFSLYAIVTIAAIIAGRVIPSFTAAAVTGARPRTSPILDRFVLATSVAAFAAYLGDAPGGAIAATAWLAAVLHAVRAIGWQPFATRRSPILWILHLSYAWMPVGFALLGCAGAGWVSPLAAFHAFGMGAVSGLIIGMITRTALGHTGRPLRVGRAETVAYGLVHAAAFVRVAALLGPPGLYGVALATSGILFSGAFVVYLFVYGPYLVSARADGKDG